MGKYQIIKSDPWLPFCTLGHHNKEKLGLKNSCPAFHAGFTSDSRKPHMARMKYHQDKEALLEEIKGNHSNRSIFWVAGYW